MRMLKVNRAWLLVFVLSVFAAGCGREQTGFVAPTVTSTTPANGDVGVPLKQVIIANFNVPMKATTLNTVTFTVTPAGGAPILGAVNYSGTTATFTPAVNLLPRTTYTATVTSGATDPAGNRLVVGPVPNPWMFTTISTTNTSAPTIISTNPINGAVAVPINQKVTATFSQPMDGTTITGTTFTLTGPGATPVAGAVTYDPGSNTAIFSPAANLAATTVFTATVTAGATNVGGTALVAGLVPNPWMFTTGTLASAVAPTITVTNPANLATGVPLNASVNATFSEAMDPTTITAANFRLTGPAATAVPGSVSYNPATFIATFTPTNPLVMNTLYTATVANGATGVKDIFGNALAAGAAPNPWSFTTGPPFVGAGPGAIDLKSAASFGAFGGTAGVTNMGINTQINNGNLGTTAVSTLITGFHDTALPGAPPPCTYTETPLNVGVVNGTIFTAPPPPTVMCPAEGTAATAAIAMQAALDTLAAYNALVAIPPGANPGANLGGLTLAPGTYTAPAGSFLLTGSDLTLNAGGNPNAVWVFQMASTLTVGAPGAPRSVILSGGAQAKNVFWQVGTAATLNGAGGGTFVGTIIAQSGITISTAGNNAPAQLVTLNGRALVLVGPVTMVNTIINVPLP